MNQCTYIGITPANTWLYAQRKRTTEPDQIIRSVCETLRLDYRSFKGDTRQQEYVWGKLIATQILKARNPLLTLTQIGRLTNRHYSTVVYHNKKFNDLIRYDKEFQQLFARVEDRLC